MTGVLSAEQIIIPYGSGGGGFTPIYDTYTTGSGTNTIPSGCSQLIVFAWGGGGGGAYLSGIGSDIEGGGGGAGGYCQSTFTITSADYGKTFNWVVGTGGSPASNGTASTVTNGTYTSNTISFSANGGGQGMHFVGGVGGTATGAQTNIPGNNGGGDITTVGGAATVGYNGDAYGGGGDGENVYFYGPFSGNNGAVIFYYS
jgi:hypothetical protein